MRDIEVELVAKHGEKKKKREIESRRALAEKIKAEFKEKQKLLQAKVKQAEK